MKKIVRVKGMETKVDLSTLDFVDGIAVSEVNLKLSYNEEILCLGILDKKGNIVFPYEPYYEGIELFPKGNFIVKTRMSSTEEKGKTWIHARRYKYDGEKLESYYDRISGTYERISDNVIKTLTLFGKPLEKCEVLFDVVAGKIISEPFSKIGEFKVQPNGEELAEAKVIVKSEHDDTEYSIIVYIDKEGNIRPVMYNTCTDEIVPYYMWEADYKTALKEEIDKIRHKDSIRYDAKQYKMDLFWNFKR